MKRNSGFSLIEVLVAMVIMVGGIIVVANAWSSNFNRVRTTRINNSMAVLLERKMTEIEIEYKDKAINEIKESDAGDFGTMYPGFTWEMVSKEFEMPDMSGEVNSEQSGGGANQEMMLMIVKTVQEFIGDTVKEVAVTVKYKSRRGNELKHTATQYFIDYTKEIPIPGLGGGGGGNQNNNQNNNRNNNQNPPPGGN